MTSSSPPPAYTPYDGSAVSAPAQPPPLPPRQSEPSLSAMASHDPRSSSQQSLVPAPGAGNSGQRKLLLVYIHGFMGNETSFQSFPAHLHNILTITMAESHVVHTKIYPKYRSRYALEVARDEFSKWLEPHESPSTDVVLLGHSMGGLLAADIALLLKHNIIGVVNFDVPFLGMHPGIVKAGLGSIFNPYTAPETPPTNEDSAPEGKRPSRMNTFFNPKPSDPNYNPNFYNDVHLPVRKGWQNALHFMNKHSNNLIAAGKGLVKTHLEFGGAMADYPQLKARYARIRALEEEDEERRQSANPETRHPPRIRFVNYYTASTGRPKKPQSPKSPSPSRPASRGLEQPPSNTNALASSSQLTLTTDTHSIAMTSPRISVDEYREDEVVPVSPDEPLSATSPEPLPQTPEGEESHHHVAPKRQQSAPLPPPELPEIPPIPTEPPFVDIAQFTDKAERKAAEKEHDKALKEYQRAVKARNKVIKERTKLQEKWEKENKQHLAQQVKLAKEQEAKEAKAEEKEVEGYFSAMDLNSQTPTQNPQASESETHSIARKPVPSPQHNESSAPYSRYEFSQSTIMSQPSPSNRSPGTPSTTNTSTYADSIHRSSHTNASSYANSTHTIDTAPKPIKYKKFCMLPPKDSAGNKDPTWVSVFMRDMDEVTAHTSLFFMGETYERLVGEVAARIEEWVREGETMRLVREMSEWERGGLEESVD